MGQPKVITPLRCVLSHSRCGEEGPESLRTITQFHEKISKYFVHLNKIAVVGLD